MNPRDYYCFVIIAFLAGMGIVFYALFTHLKYNENKGSVVLECVPVPASGANSSVLKSMV